MSPHTEADRELALKFFATLNSGDFDRLGELLIEDVVIEWPQSRERVRGLANAIRIFSQYPGGLSQADDRVVFAQGDDHEYLLTPMFTVVRSGGGRDFFTMVVRSRYPDGSYWYVIIMFKSHEGRLAHVVNYFAPVYDAPEWRAQWVERMEDSEL